MKYLFLWILLLLTQALWTIDKINFTLANISGYELPKDLKIIILSKEGSRGTYTNVPFDQDLYQSFNDVAINSSTKKQYANTDSSGKIYFMYALSKNNELFCTSNKQGIPVFERADQGYFDVVEILDVKNKKLIINDLFSNTLLIFFSYGIILSSLILCGIGFCSFLTLSLIHPSLVNLFGKFNNRKEIIPWFWLIVLVACVLIIVNFVVFSSISQEWEPTKELLIYITIYIGWGIVFSILAWFLDFITNNWELILKKIIISSIATPISGVITLIIVNELGLNISSEISGAIVSGVTFIIVFIVTPE